MRKICFISLLTRGNWLPCNICMVCVFVAFVIVRIYDVMVMVSPSSRNIDDKISIPLIQNVIDNIDNATRHFISDNTTDGFNSSFYNYLDDRGKHDCISNYISVKRQLRDVRHPECKAKLLATNNLQRTSIIIIFCNERLSFILRTIWSILCHTPCSLLHEIILIDDASNTTEIKALPWFLAIRFPKDNIRIFRNAFQMSLMESKNIGARSAEGK